MSRGRFRSWGIGVAAAGALWLGPVGSAAAQDAGTDGPFPFMNPSQTQTKKMADPAESLSNSLRILAASPRNLDALATAGAAALAVGDVDAALSFWSRADEVAPRSARVKAGLASAFLQSQQPRIALKLFDDAVDLGFPESEIASDRGLARDLRGDNRRAQHDYAVALAAGPDDETTRRLALSQAIAGNRVAALATLDPLLRKQDKAAWRAKTFIDAMTGNIADASATVHQLLPEKQAEQMVPFLARLANLRPSQKAAAVHFGALPPPGALRNETVGVADGTILQSTPAITAAQPGWRAPAAAPVGPSAGLVRRTPDVTQPATGPSVPRAAPVVAAPPPPVAAPSQPAVPVIGLPAPEVDAAAPDRAPTEIAATTPAPVEKPAATKPAPKPKPKPEPDKARIWVQVAGGANRNSLGREWERLKKSEGSLYRSRTPHVIGDRATNRLVVGPFDSEAEAQAYVNQLSRAGRSGFRVKSEKGQKVAPLKE